MSAGALASVQRRLFRRWFLDLGGGPEDCVLLVGSGRSGTTWLAELIEHHGRDRYLFEPFHPDRSPAGRTVGVRPYLPAGAEPSVRTGAVDRVVRGRIRDPWVDQYNRRALAPRRLIKDVWCAMSLGVILGTQPGIRVILMLRNPTAVVRSQVASGWDWHVEPEALLRQRALVDDHLGPFQDLVASAEGFDRHLVTWCVENLVALRAVQGTGAHVVLYEHLRADPEAETRRLFTYLGRRWSPRVLDRVNVPSALARRAIAPAAPVGPRSVEATLARFGLDAIYGDEPTPRVAAGAPVVPGISTTGA